MADQVTHSAHADGLPQRRTLPHGIPSWAADGAVFFITICCQERGKDTLCQEPVARAVFDSVTFRHERHDWFVHLWLLMPDHLHGLVSFPQDKSMKQVISKWKEWVAKHAHIRWQRDFFDHRLRRDESFEEKAHYIRMNPVRAGLVGRPEDWPYVWARSSL